MRILRYLLWFPFVIIASLLILALCFPKATIENNYVIDAPIINTWNYFHNQSKMPLWMDGFKRLQVIEETPNKIDSKYILHFQVDGNDMMMNQTITYFEIYKKFGFTIENPGANSYNSIAFIENENNSTSIIQKTIIKPTSFFFRPVLPIVKIAMSKKNNKNYNRLKKLIEEEYKS